jgi:hypothetical protein
MTRKKPSAYYSCNPTKELAKYTGLTALTLLGFLVLWLGVSAVSSVGSKPEAKTAAPVCFEMRPTYVGCRED